jgi:hypothetical protein
MKDFQASLEKLRKDAAEYALIRDLATNPTKREMFNRLSQHLNRLADEVGYGSNVRPGKFKLRPISGLMRFRK